MNNIVHSGSTDTEADDVPNTNTYSLKELISYKLKNKKDYNSFGIYIAELLGNSSYEDLAAFFETLNENRYIANLLGNSFYEDLAAFFETLNENLEKNGNSSND